MRWAVGLRATVALLDYRAASDRDLRASLHRGRPLAAVRVGELEARSGSRAVSATPAFAALHPLPNCDQRRL